MSEKDKQRLKNMKKNYREAKKSHDFFKFCGFDSVCFMHYYIHSIEVF